MTRQDAQRLIGRRVLIPPRDSGEGEPPEVRWEGRGPRRNFGNDNETLIQTPPPPRFAWSPSPASAGADDASALVPGHAFASELCKTSHVKPETGAEKEIEGWRLAVALRYARFASTKSVARMERSEIRGTISQL